MESDKQEYYLTKAKEADELAEHAKSILTRDAWRRIAQNYRVLAGVKRKALGQTGPVPGEEIALSADWSPQR